MSAPTSSENKSLTFFFSENDIFSFEIEAGGTQFQADSDSRAAVETLVDGDQWMIYRNVITDVLHWDFVSFAVCSTCFVFLTISFRAFWGGS